MTEIMSKTAENQPFIIETRLFFEKSGSKIPFLIFDILDPNNPADVATITSLMMVCSLDRDGSLRLEEQNTLTQQALQKALELTGFTDEDIQTAVNLTLERYPTVLNELEQRRADHD